MGFNLPDGCETHHIPGFRKEDQEAQDRIDAYNRLDEWEKLNFWEWHLGKKKVYEWVIDLFYDDERINLSDLIEKLEKIYDDVPIVDRWEEYNG